jgi:hypothetical protein
VQAGERSQVVAGEIFSDLMTSENIFHAFEFYLILMLVPSPWLIISVVGHKIYSAFYEDSLNNQLIKFMKSLLS